MTHPVTERILYLCNTLWDGNRSRMAQDLGLSATAINQLAHGLRNPGNKILTALSKHPQVNYTWLLTGEGQPIPGVDQLAAATGQPIPVLEHPLAGPPEAAAARLSSQSTWLASTLYRPTRYLLRVSERHLVTRNKLARVAAGDLLLVETESFWLDDPRRLDGKLAVVETADPQQSRLEVGLIEAQVNVLDREDRPDLRLTFRLTDKQTLQLDMPRTGSKPHLRGVDPKGYEQLQQGLSPESQPPEHPPVLLFSAIKGVVVLLLRT